MFVMAVNISNPRFCSDYPTRMTGGDNTTEEGFKQIWEEFNRLRLDGQLCDVVLVSGGNRFAVHRAMLAANSPFFRALFTNGMKETYEDRIDLPKTDPTILQMILDFIYTRSIIITMDNVFTLLIHADAFFVSDLVEKCSEFICSNLSSSNCASILKFAQTYYKSDLLTAARAFLLKNFVQVAQRSLEFLSVLDADDLCDLISDNSLNVTTEELVFETIVHWIDYCNSTRAQHMPMFLRRMRLGLMASNYFVEKVSSHPYVIQTLEQCEAIIKDAWNVLYYLQKHGCQGISLSSMYIRPRIPHGVLFALGGWSGGSPISFVETYDIRAGRWYSHPMLEDTAPRAYHGLAAIGDVMYVIGGFDGRQYYNSVKCFNAKTKAWKDVAPMYAQRCYVSTAIARGFIYACGGYDGRYRLSSAERYDAQNNQWSQIEPMHERRSDAGSDVLHGNIFLVGGFNGEHCLSSAEIYSPSFSQWTLITSLNGPRSGVSIVAFMDYIYAIGGFDGERRLSSCERYCPIMKQWEPVASMLAARSNFAVGVIDDVLFAIGGFDGSVTIPHVECYNGATNQWHVTTDMNINRSALKACVIDDLPNITDYTYYGHLADQGDVIIDMTMVD